ncbi:MAG: 1-acyl-sn-glycerol-3-phosphate acyltransferase [bacterium]|nr:1-acyl-sn-glycerol-3-phosphate acyltransferase [bacterium]
MESFIPPGFNLPIAWMVDFSFPLLLKQVQNIDAIVLKPEDEQMLRKLRHERLIYLSNHPSTSEPPVSYHVANRMGSRFNFMASRQVFDWGYGMVGRFIQNIGAFSIIPGASDRESLKASRAILAKARGKLVLYPEGEPTSGENDNLMPFQPGVAQLGFWGLDDARKIDADADIKVLPSFVKYVMVGTDASIKAELHASLTKIEKRYKIDPGNKNLLRRFLTVGRVLLEETEREYQVPMAAKDDFDYRIGRARHAILDGIARRVGVHAYNERDDAIQKLRVILSTLEMVELKLKDPRLPILSEKELAWAKREAMKAYDVIVIKPGYLVSRPTAERFFEWLARFENYVYGSTSPRARKAHVFFGPVQSLKDFEADYRANKRKGVEKLTAHLRGITQELLEEALELSQPLVRPGDIESSDI